MVPFNIAIEMQDKSATAQAEQLNQLADNEGFMPYRIAIGERFSVIYVNIENDVRPPITRQDTEAYFEAIHYPEQVFAYTEDDIFTLEEARIIGATIRQYNRSQNLNFDQLQISFNTRS
jgi:hypothetical protein